MAGHSKFHNIKHRKGAQDQKRAKVFTKILKEIEIASKSGSDPSSNSKLRGAIITARGANVPKDRIENAINKGSGTGGANYEEIKYEGYGSNGVTFIVEVLTDNKNRSAASIRATFNKHGGALAESGAVSFMFNKIGLIEYDKNAVDEEQIFDLAIELDATSIDTEENLILIATEVSSFAKTRDSLIEKFENPISAEIIWQAKNKIDINKKDTAETIIKLIDILEDNDDVNRVYHNANFNEAILKELY